ncbi:MULTISPECIES: DUF930 domain-containing protein [unclassified Sinorhizobium]|uniref:DUF930 domain-containing protein n=1 Tax=unclassified Sinorhizobium TaxID=2613772 RepID=UPI0024C22327|nr:MULTISPECIES: DUF930 domain-containing protein [unclassified Sinorhizobium]MDK1374590.1 DUF930 domain-containing protein [Sinorhizobium sp. 6-70]MDK1478210.1 DUF930 domain-containing protein [Sinorhizobium sp. 6-117]
MQQFAKEPKREIAWGMPTSVALHLAVAFLLLFRLPEAPPEPAKEQSVNVELVPPPRPKAQKPPAEPAKSGAKPSAAQPQAFESASARADVNEEQQPPPKQGEAQQAPKAVEQPEPTPSKTETAARETPEPKPAPPVLAMPQPDAAIQQGEAEAASPEGVPVPAQRPPPETAEKQQPSEPAGAKVEQKSDALVPAKELFSPNALSNPRIKQALGKLPVKKRIAQICSIEALEQIRNQRPDAFPDMLARAGTISTSAVTAIGSAYRSKAKWYNVDFKCEVDADATAVTSFSFAIGGAVPKSEWNARELPLN